MRIEDGPWTKYRELPDVMEVDFHQDPHGGGGNGHIPFAVRMEGAYDTARDSLRYAYESGYQYVLFRHGSSTSGPGRTSSRSMVRRLMRGKTATPYILRSKCIQHYSVFVAAIRPNPDPRGKQARLKQGAMNAAVIARSKAGHEAAAAKRWPELCKEYRRFIVQITDDEARGFAETCPDYLMEHEKNFFTRVMKLSGQLNSYQDQQRRKCRIFDPK